MAVVGAMPVKILAQFGDNEPVEIGAAHFDIDCIQSMQGDLTATIGKLHWEPAGSDD